MKKSFQSLLVLINVFIHTFFSLQFGQEYFNENQQKSNFKTVWQKIGILWQNCCTWLKFWSRRKLQRWIRIYQWKRNNLWTRNYGYQRDQIGGQNKGAKYLVSLSSLSLKLREKYISCSVCIFFEGCVITFQFLIIKFIIKYVNYLTYLNKHKIFYYSWLF